MAFNPFHSFRRYQKAIFATMAIVCMVLFVLSSGVGGTDLLHQFTDWFSRGRGGKGQAAASIDGKDIGQEVVSQTMQQRKLANLYVRTVGEQANFESFASIANQRAQYDPTLQNAIDHVDNYFRNHRGRMSEQTFQYMFQTQQQLRQVGFMLNLGNIANKDDQVKTANVLSMVMERELNRKMRDVQNPRDSFFGGSPESTEDTIDFMLWKRQADKLGIHMMAEDVKNAISSESLGQVFSPEVNKNINRFLAENVRGYSLAMLDTALIDEFRVRAAKRTMMGGGPSTPDVASPEELFEWYKDNRTTMNIGLIEVPVASFVDKVTEKPTEAQLKDLYEKHKNDEFNPQLERPGFKEPRKVKVEWLAFPNNSPFYAKATELAPVFSALAQFGTPAVSGDGGPAFGVSTLMTAREAMSNLTPELIYREYLQMLPSWFDRDAFGAKSGIHDSSVLRPENIAILAATSIASGATGAGPFAGPVALEGRVIVRETRDRARIGCSMILGSALDPAPLGFNVIASELIPQLPTEASLRGILAERQRERLTDGLLTSDRDLFATELSKRSKEQDRNNVEAFINEFIHARQLPRGGTKDAVDRFALADDPGMAEIRAAYNKRNTKDTTGDQFAADMADGDPRYPPANYNCRQLTGPTLYLNWRSEDREPRAVTFDIAKPKVEAAWIFEKARALAKAEAERIAGEAKNRTDRELRDLAAKSSAKGLVEVNTLARINQKNAYTAGGAPQYEGPTIPPEKAKFAPELVAKVIDLRKESAGATAMAPDFAKANYYVAALMTKEVPSADSFRMAYKGSMAAGSSRDMLFDYYRSERQDQFRKALTKQLRDEASVKINKNDKKSEDEGS